MQVELHVNLENGVAEGKPDDWKKEINIDPKLEPHGNKFIQMMTELESIYDWHFGGVRITKCQIEMGPWNNQPVQCTHVQSGNKSPWDGKSRDG